MHVCVHPRLHMGAFVVRACCACDSLFAGAPLLACVCFCVCGVCVRCCLLCAVGESASHINLFLFCLRACLYVTAHLLVCMFAYILLLQAHGSYPLLALRCTRPAACSASSSVTVCTTTRTCPEDTDYPRHRQNEAVFVSGSSEQAIAEHHQSL